MQMLKLYQNKFLIVLCTIIVLLLLSIGGARHWKEKQVSGEGKASALGKDSFFFPDDSENALKEDKYGLYSEASPRRNAKRRLRGERAKFEEFFHLPDVTLERDAPICPSHILEYAETADSQLLNVFLKHENHEALMDSLVYLMRNGGIEDKCAVLFVIETIWNNDRIRHLRQENDFVFASASDSNGEDDDYIDDAPLITRILLSGLDSDDEEVRSRSFETINGRPDELSNPIFLFILARGDTELKMEVLNSRVGSERKEDVTLFFHALDDDDYDIHDFAKSNLNQLFNIVFENSDEALNWWERHLDEKAEVP